jgi:hypothetical protein
MVALEAAAAGCPVVLFDGPIGVAEMLSEKEATFVPYLDVDEMAKAVLAELGRDQNRATETPIWERYPWSRCLDVVAKAIQAAAEPPTFDKTGERSTVSSSSAAWACGSLRATCRSPGFNLHSTASFCSPTGSSSEPA